MLDMGSRGVRLDTMRDTELMSISETLAYLRAAGQPRTRTALVKRINRGTLPATKVGSQWVVRRSDVDALIAALRREH